MTVTCATLAAILATATPGSTITLAKGSDCSNVRITRDMPRQTTINLGGSTLRGTTITGSGWRLRSGTLRATGGAHASGPAGYGLKIAGQRIRIDGVLVTDAKKGVVVDQAATVTIADSRFLRLGEDGIIASRVRGFQVLRNRFAEVIGKPTECQTAGGVLPGLSRRDCEARGGVWKDGYHADAVQMRNGVTNALIESNEVNYAGQGLTQMDTTGDAPLESVVIRGNRVRADGHHITLGNCLGCSIIGNDVGRYGSASFKAVIRAGTSRRCGNVAQDEKPDGAC